MSDNVKKVLLVGPGNMGIEYAKVLKALQVEMTVVGRGEKKAKQFYEETGIHVQCGDIKNIVNNMQEIPQYAIVAVSVEHLAQVTLNLLESGVKNILVEKPGALLYSELKELCQKAKEKQANVYVAYNRRFYASTIEAKRIIEEDGGLQSFNFEFTEWGFRVESVVQDKSELIKENWLLANSTHVIDLAFFLGGKPKEIATYTSGELSWHKSGCVYAGAGMTTKGALFSYGANWDAPGRWAVEMLTSKHRIYLKPMEELHIQDKGTVVVRKMDMDDTLDIQFKPGLYRETKAFLFGEGIENLETIEEQMEAFKLYAKIERKE